MTSAPAGTLERDVGTAIAGVVGVGGLIAAKFQEAALKARSVAGEVASPGLRLACTRGVFGDTAGLSDGSVVGRTGRSSSISTAACCLGCSVCIVLAELVNENFRGSRKTAGGAVARESGSEGFLRFLDCGVADAVLPSFFGLPRFLGANSDAVASSGSVAALFFGLSRFFNALSAGMLSALSMGADAGAIAVAAGVEAVALVLC